MCFGNENVRPNKIILRSRLFFFPHVVESRWSVMKLRGTSKPVFVNMGVY